MVDPLAPRRCSCSHRLHGAASTYHRKAEIELFGARCELEHVYTKNERIAVDAVARELRWKRKAAKYSRESSLFTRVKEVLNAGVLPVGSEAEAVRPGSPGRGAE